MKWSALSLLPLLSSLVRAAPSVPNAPGWRFDLKNTTSGVVALESIVVSPTLVVFLDRASDDPLQINGHSAWGALWNLETSTVRPLDVLTNSICASGALLSNGTMASVGGNNAFFDGNPFIHPGGTRTIRIFEPCASPTGEGCTLFENPDTFTLLADRYYPSSIRIFDGSLMIIGGANQAADFFNDQMPENSFEFFPRKEDAVRPSVFLARSEPANLFPRAFALPDGTVFMVANNQSIIYDIEKNTETILPDIPNNVRVTNPVDGSAILLPLSPPDFIPEVLVCGGSQADISDRSLLSSQTPATTQCSRITLTPEGIARGWEVEHMLEPRTLPELVHIPNGQVLITNGAQSGFAGTGNLPHPIGNSNADHPALTPSIYTPDAPLGQRISNEGMPTTNIARMYHSSVTLTPQGNFLIAGSNPNGMTVVGPNVTFPSEFRVETLDPPFMFVERPKILDIPDKVPFGQSITVPISLPSSLSNPDAKVQVALMDLGFSSHAFHSGARLVFMDATISSDSKSLTFVTPPNGRVYPPGPATVFLTVDNVTSEGAWVIVGSGNSPPTLE